jgi:pimeloyl-ACP methyl ester carboxylesterase
MPYTVTGDGETTVLMVHCWMCQGDFWDAQVPVVAQRFRAIVVDLPGHGDAGDDRESWSIAGYGADIADLIKDLDLERVVLVGHSMGGPVSLRAAALAGDRVIGVIAVDTLHDAEFDFDQPAVEQMVTAFETDFRGMCNQMVEQMFVEDDVDDVLAEVRRVGCEEGNAEAGLALMRDFAAIDLAELFSEAGVPIRAINAAEPNPTQIETNRKYADFDAVLMEGVGHYLHMTRPDEFNTLLLEQLDRLVGAPTA